MAKRLLLVDDEPHVLKALKRELRPLGLEIQSSSDPVEALALCQEQQFDLILSDQRMPGVSGIELLTLVAKLQPDSRRMILSGFSDFDAVTDAFNNGLIEKFIRKPWDRQELLFTLGSALESTATPKSETGGLNCYHGILSNDAKMQALFAAIPKLASANAPISIFGETGTGKELCARAIHAESCRADGPMVAVNCANFSEQLMESELFGHKKGAFTHATSDREGLLAEANGGTLFLDEVTTLSLELQAKLLRVLQEREYRPLGSNRLLSFDLQLISASSERIDSAVADGHFRSDLQYRLAVLPLELPPLRERGQDAERLLGHFLAELAPERSFSLANDLLEFVRQYRWPGNIRELYNAAQFMAAMAASDRLHCRHLPAALQQNESQTAQGAASAPTSKAPAPDSAGLSLEQMDCNDLEQHLALHGNNRTQAAAALGISRMTLWRRMKALDLL